MSTGTKRTMICCICMQRIDATIVQAKAHGWTVWVGGAFCKRHVEADDEPLRSEIDKWKKAAAATQWDLEQTKKQLDELAASISPSDDSSSSRSTEEAQRLLRRCANDGCRHSRSDHENNAALFNPTGCRVGVETDEGRCACQCTAFIDEEGK